MHIDLADDMRKYLDNIEYTMKAINSIHNVGNWRTINTNNVI
jgi:hypothetical protein